MEDAGRRHRSRSTLVDMPSLAQAVRAMNGSTQRSPIRPRHSSRRVGCTPTIQREQMQLYTDRVALDLLPLLMDALARDPAAARLL